MAPSKLTWKRQEVRRCRRPQPPIFSTRNDSLIYGRPDTTSVIIVGHHLRPETIQRKKSNRK
eukprot:scaffold225932_cov20-Attheya_sp.AAC.1